MSSGSPPSGPRSLPGERALARYFLAFEAGKLSPERCEERVSALAARVDDLREQESELAVEEGARPPAAVSADDLAAVADQLERVIAEASPEKAKALLRLLIQELKVNGRSEILPTYRVVAPSVCATSDQVERTGIEPVTSGLQSRRSPS